MADNDYIMKRFYVGLPPVWEIKDACGFTWKDLALKMNVTEMTLWRWNGGAEIPLEKRVKLREILDLYRRKG